MRRHDFRIRSVDLTAENLQQHDATVIVTDHSAYDYEQIVKYSSLVVDTRNATHSVRCDPGKIVRC